MCDITELNDTRKNIEELKDQVIGSLSTSEFYKGLKSLKSIFSKNVTLIDKLYVLIDVCLNRFDTCKTSNEQMIACSINLIQQIGLYIVLKENDINDFSNSRSIEEKFNKKMSELFNHILEKNRKYGNSALNPLRIMSKANELEQLFVRVDDKLNRMINRQNDEDEDLPFDIIGYFVLICVCCKLRNDK